MSEQIRPKRRWIPIETKMDSLFQKSKPLSIRIQQQLAHMKIVAIKIIFYQSRIVVLEWSDKKSITRMGCKPSQGKKELE